MVMGNLAIIKYLSCNRLCGLSFRVQASGRGVTLNPTAMAFPGAGSLGRDDRKASPLPTLLSGLLPSFWHLAD